MRSHPDKTSDIAIGAVDREWRQMASIAVKIREGRCSPQYESDNRKRFTGIYSRLLEDPIDELKKEARRHR